MGRLDNIHTALKPLRKIRKNWKHFFVHFRTFKINVLNNLKRWPGPTRPGPIVTTWNFDTILNQIFNLDYYNLRSIFLIYWKLYDFRQRSNFGIFQQFSHHNFQQKWIFLILMVSSERSSLDISEYTLFKEYLFIYENQLSGEKKM